MSVVDDVKQRIDIVDLLSQSVTLKRTGRTYMALCPFHSERTPSFHVDPARQTWHCFGACGTGGDIFGFVMKQQGCEFREALHLLAERAGISVEAQRDTQADARRARVFDINDAAAAFFHATLLADQQRTTSARIARDYLAERGMADESVERFQIGYAPNSWDGLMSHLRSRGFDAPELIEAGLAVSGDRGAYDRFRHRLMFPVRDDRGRIAGFGGRLLPGDALGAGDVQPKYVNTSQSPVFDKGSILYALDLAKDAIRSEGRAVIVEGYMDAIAAHEHGFANVVASMGTALTERQVALLKRYSSTLVLALDADDAGSEATIRSAYEIVNSSLRRRPMPNSRGIVRHVETIDIDLRVLSMPAGRDPDDVIRSEPGVWPELVAGALPVLDYLFDVAAKRRDLSLPRERSALVAELAPIIAVTADRVVQSHYLQRLGRLAQTDEATLRLEMRQPVRSRTTADAPVDGPTTEAAGNASRDRREEFCLALLLKYPELRDEGMALDAALFGQSENRALFQTWVGSTDDGESFEQSLTPDLRPQHERILALDLPLYDDRDLINALRTTVWGIEQQELRRAKRAKTSVIAGIGAGDGAPIVGQAGDGRALGTDAGDPAEEEADPAAVFVDDMEAGLKVHRRLLDQHNAGQRARRGGE